VIKLGNVNKQNVHFLNYCLIQFFMYATCFEHLVFIIRETINGLPDSEHFKKNLHFVGLHYIIN